MILALGVCVCICVCACVSVCVQQFWSSCASVEDLHWAVSPTAHMVRVPQAIELTSMWYCADW